MEKKALTDANYIFAIILVLLVLLNSLFPKGLIGSQGFWTKSWNYKQF